MVRACTIPANGRAVVWTCPGVFVSNAVTVTADNRYVAIGLEVLVSVGVGVHVRISVEVFVTLCVVAHVLVGVELICSVGIRISIGLGTGVYVTCTAALTATHDENRGRVDCHDRDRKAQGSKSHRSSPHLPANMTLTRFILDQLSR